jgi:hypothetical protein
VLTSVAWCSVPVAGREEKVSRFGGGSYPALIGSSFCYCPVLPAYLAYPCMASFSMLCTKQKSFHCPSTLVWPRSVKRVSPLL